MGMSSVHDRRGPAMKAVTRPKKLSRSRSILFITLFLAMFACSAGAKSNTPSKEVLTQPCWLQVRAGRETSTRRRLAPPNKPTPKLECNKSAWEDYLPTSKTCRFKPNKKNPHGGSLPGKINPRVGYK